MWLIYLFLLVVIVVLGFALLWQDYQKAELRQQNSLLEIMLANAEDRIDIMAAQVTKLSRQKYSFLDPADWWKE
jgi:cell division protein FtsL